MNAAQQPDVEPVAAGTAAAGTVAAGTADAVRARALLAEVFTSAGEGLLAALTCSQADMLAMVFAALGDPGSGVIVIAGHAQDIASNDNMVDDTHEHLIDTDALARGQVQIPRHRYTGISEHLAALMDRSREPGDFWPGVDPDPDPELDRVPDLDGGPGGGPGDGARAGSR